LAAYVGASVSVHFYRGRADQASASILRTWVADERTVTERAGGQELCHEDSGVRISHRTTFHRGDFKGGTVCLSVT
jgi:hypothetical protein